MEIESPNPKPHGLLDSIKKLCVTRASAINLGLRSDCTCSCQARIHPSACQALWPSCLSMCLPACLSVCLSVRVYACMYVCTYVRRYVGR